MAKKVKGIKIKKDLEEKFKFKNDGTSIFGDSTESAHEMKGTGSVTGSMEVEGALTLKERLSGFLFSPPHIDASIETTMVQHFVDNAESQYEGFLVYVTNPAAQEPFNLANKFYFCENGVWHPSPFSGEIVNYAPNLNPTYEISVPVQGTDSVPFSLDLPADLFQDQDGDALVYTATLQGGGPLPAWLSFDATNTILSGTPSESDVGLLSVLITATDPSNASAATTQEIQILAKPVPFWQGGTNSFGTSGPEDWATVLPSNLLSLNPIQGGSNAWHKITAPDEFNVFSKTVSIDFSLADWYNSSGAGSSNNMIAVGLQCTTPSATTDFAEFYINDNGSGKYLLPRLNHKNGLVNNYSGGLWSYDPYDPPEDISNMEDFDFRIEIGRAAKHHSWNAYYVPVLVLAKRRTPHQDLIGTPFENISFEDLRTQSEFGELYPTLSYPERNKHFFRSQYSMLIHTGAYDVDDLNFQPYVKSVQRFPHDTTTPVAIFDKFDITVDESPVEDVNIPFGDFTVEEGQPITITVPSDLFVDPEGETPLVYGTRRTSYQAIPNWLSFDTSTGVYTGTPGADDVGSYEIAVWGMDDASESAGQISNPQASYARTFTLTVTEAPPTEANPTVPGWDTPGNYIVGQDGSLTLDGAPTGVFHTAEDTSSSTDLLSGITFGETSTALVFEWEYDPSDTNGQGIRNLYGTVGLINTDDSSEIVRILSLFPGEDDRMMRGEKRPGNTQNTLWMSLGLPDQPADWTWRIIIQPTLWFQDGSEKLRQTRWSIAGLKKSGTASWSDAMNSTQNTVGLLEQNDVFMRQGGVVNTYANSAAVPAEVNYHPHVWQKPDTNNNTAEFHLINPKIFFLDLDE